MFMNEDLLHKLRLAGFEKRLENLPCEHEGLVPARVVAVHKESFLVYDGTGDIFAEISGKFRFEAEVAEDYPCAGDWVWAATFDNNELAVIHEVMPRKSLLKRKAAGVKSGIQLIAANVDYAFIVQSLDRDFNLARLERYLVIAREAQVTPVILLNKCDLENQEETNRKISDIREREGELTVIPCSIVNGTGLDKISSLLQPGKTCALLGSSGVGKTSLLNYLSGGQSATGSVREKDSRGRHTTTVRELIRLPNGAMIIDNPGMRELGLIDAGDGLEETFADIERLAVKCKFADCSHVGEKGCAVLEAVRSGELSEKRHENYLKLRREAEFHDMSLYEKRQKDKKFGKMVKNVMKLKKRD